LTNFYPKTINHYSVIVMAVEKSILYFDEVGEVNTEATLEAAKRRAEELGVRDIVVASTRGGTGLRAAELFKGYNVVVVTHSAGFREPGKLEVPEETLAKIRGAGGRVLTTGHAFMGVSAAMRKKFNTVGPGDMVANVLRLFGQGMKVVVECSYMAADAGMIPMGRDIIAIAGSGRGADTAVVLKPAHQSEMFDLCVREIIAKPRTR
jgi:hypothetical protein